jgi:hypothetical protein
MLTALFKGLILDRNFKPVRKIEFRCNKRTAMTANQILLASFYRPLIILSLRSFYLSSRHKLPPEMQKVYFPTRVRLSNVRIAKNALAAAIQHFFINWAMEMAERWNEAQPISR